MDYDVAKVFCRQRASAGGGVDFLSVEELRIELEDLLLGTDLSREEYVDRRVLRRGMRQPLSGAQREVI